MDKTDWQPSDWDDMLTSRTSTNVFETLFPELCPTFYLGWICLLYKKYRLGDWNNTIPDVDTFKNLEYIMWDNETYCLYHKNHAKFGAHIIECGHPYKSQVFDFFDYNILKSVFDALDYDKEIPYIPRYHADITDRYDYQNGKHMWSDE